MTAATATRPAATQAPSRTWSEEAEALLADAERWAAGQPDWGTRRYEFDGAPRLLVHTPRGRFMLGPGERSGDWTADYYKIPSLSSEFLVHDGGWYWQGEGDDFAAPPPRRPWTEETFLDLTERLADAP